MVHNLQQNFPTIPTKFTDEEGRITRVWLELLRALWERTGGAAGGSTDDAELFSALLGEACQNNSNTDTLLAEALAQPQESAHSKERRHQDSTIMAQAIALPPAPAPVYDDLFSIASAVAYLSQRGYTVINGTANQISVATTSSAATISIADSPVFPGTGGAAAAYLTGGNATNPGAILSGGLRLLSPDDTTAGFSVDTFGTGQPQVTFRRALTSAAAPSAVTNGTVLGQVDIDAYMATAYSTGNRASMVFRAAEDWDDTANGTEILFNVTIPGGSTEATPLVMGSSVLALGTNVSLSFGGTGAATTRTNLSLVPGTDIQIQDADLQALADNASSGLWARTGAGTGSVRTITGTANQVTVANGSGVSGNPTLSITTNPTLPGRTTIAAGTTSLAQYALDISATWNNGAFIHNGIRYNVTNTASAAASSLFDLQVGGSSKFKVRKDGKTVATGVAEFVGTDSGAVVSKFGTSSSSTTTYMELEVYAGAAGRMDVGFLSPLYTPAGMFRSAGGYLRAGGAGGLSIFTAAAQPIYFGYNSTEVFQVNSGAIDISSGNVLKVNGTQVLTSQQGAISDASGGATVDSEARTAINALLAACRTHGMIAT